MIELEKSIINYLLIDNSKIGLVIPELDESFFLNKNSKKIYKALTNLYQEGKSNIDMIMINSWLKSNNLSLIDIEYESTLFDNIDTFDVNVLDHINIIKENSVCKNIENIFKTFLSNQNSSSNTNTLENILSSLNQIKLRLNQIKEDDIESQFKELDDEVEKIKSGEFQPITFGLEELDKFYNFNFTDLIIVAGRPGMGKTAFVISALEWFNFKDFKPIFISLEMSSKQIIQRMVCNEMNVSISDIRINRFNPDKYYQSRKKVYNRVKDSFIYDKVFSITQIESIIQQKSILGSKIIIIDYLQLVEGGKGDNKTNEVGDITRRLKLCAKKYNVTIVLLSQLSRKVEERRDKRPLLSDLRDSGSIEQDADSVLFLYREYYYNDELNPNDAEIIISKNRHGSTGYVTENFISYAGIFKNKVNG